MNTVRSSDGTLIAYDRVGTGPAIIMVGGALSDRAGAASLAAALAPRLSAIAYDRRGRGDSGDTPPYAVEREIEDLDALIVEAGGQAFVYGHSSGAALAMEAVVSGLPITKLALRAHPGGTVAAGRRGDAVEYFWREGLQLPPEMITQMRAAPWWPGMEALAHTLSYDGEVMGDHMTGKPLPAEWAARVTIPTLVIDGAESPAQLRNAVAAVTDLLPHAERRTLAGQGHGAPAEVLAPILEAFLLG